LPGTEFERRGFTVQPGRLLIKPPVQVAIKRAVSPLPLTSLAPTLTRRHARRRLPCIYRHEESGGLSITKCCGSDAVVSVTQVPASRTEVPIGDYSLDPEGRDGSFAQFQPANEKENRRALDAALAAEPEEEPTLIAAVAELQEDAAAVADRIERGEKLFRAALGHELLEPQMLTTEIDVLLALFTRLDRAGRFEEELRLMRVLRGLLVLALRWIELVRSLRRLLASARKAGHLEGQGWALHELGTLNLCAGRPKEAENLLQEALRTENMLGQTAARCATRHNLDNARRDVREGIGTWRARRLLRLAGLVGVLAVLGGGSSAIAFAIPWHRHHGPSPVTMVLTVRPAGDGSGTVTSSPSGINCDPSCEASFPDGTQVILTAKADPGSTFAGWRGGDCRGTGPCTLTVNRDIRTTAVFGVPTHILVVDKKGNGSGTITSSPSGINCDPSCKSAFRDGAQVTLTAKADPGSTFGGWPKGSGCRGTEPCTLTVNRDIHITTVFRVPIVG